MIEPIAINDLSCMVEFKGSESAKCTVVTHEQNGVRGIAFFFDQQTMGVYFFGREDMGPTMAVTDMAIGDTRPTPVLGGECAVTSERITCRATFRNGEVIRVVAW